MLVDAAKHLGLPIMHRKPCNRAFSQGKHVAPLLDYARINELVLPLSALSANQNGLATPSRRAGQGGAHALPVRCAQSRAYRLLEMQQQCFFVFRFFSFGLGYQLSAWLRIHSSRQFPEALIFKSMPLPKRAL